MLRLEEVEPAEQVLDRRCGALGSVSGWRWLPGRVDTGQPQPAAWSRCRSYASLKAR